MSAYHGYSSEDLADIYADLSQPVDIDCLLPSGVLVPIRCVWDSTLGEIKSKLWQEARGYPNFSMLKAEGHYLFVGVNMDAEKEELMDEKKRYCDLNLFHPLLKVVEVQGDQNEKLLNAEIGNLIGKRLHDLEVMGPEVHDFRCKILHHCKDVVDQRNKGWQSQLLCAYPPDIESSPDLPPALSTRMRAHGLEVDMHVLTTTNPPQKCSAVVVIPPTAYPDALVEQTLKKKFAPLTMQREDPRDYVLKVCGREEYLLKRVPLSQYRYIRNCIMRQEKPQLTFKHRNDVSKNVMGSEVFKMPVGIVMQAAQVRGSVEDRHCTVERPSAVSAMNCAGAFFVCCLDNGAHAWKNKQERTK